MRIAYFTESLPPLTDGEARTFTRLVETLNEQKINFRIISPSVPVDEEPWRGRVIQVPSVTFPLYRYYRVGLPPVLKLEKALNEFKPDLIHVSAPTPISIYGQNYAFRHKIPSVADYHTHFVDYFPYYGLGWAAQAGWNYMKWFHNRSQFTFAPTPGTVSELISRGFRGVQLWLQRYRSSKIFIPSTGDLKTGAVLHRHNQRTVASFCRSLSSGKESLRTRPSRSNPAPKGLSI